MNFEKKTWEYFKRSLSLADKTDDEILAIGYNTCLDVTNAKGLRDVLEECYLFLFDNRLNPELTNKIVTELQKAESKQ